MEESLTSLVSKHQTSIHFYQGSISVNADPPQVDFMKLKFIQVRAL